MKQWIPVLLIAAVTGMLAAVITSRSLAPPTPPIAESRVDSRRLDNPQANHTIPSPRNGGEPVTSDDHSVKPAAQLQARVAALEVALRDEQQTSLLLHRELRSLEQRLADAALADGDGTSNPGTETAVHDAADLDVRGVTDGRFVGESGSGISSAALVAAGLDSAAAAEIVARQDAYTLTELDVRDQAAREGWLDAEDFDERLAERLPTPVDVRSELDDGQWDRYLYNAGRPNRVSIAGVLNGSAAQDANVHAGDQVLRYADRSIHSMRELRRLTREGERGEAVAVQILRDNEILELIVPRGPLGVTMSPKRVDPDGSVGIQ